MAATVSILICCLAFIYLCNGVTSTSMDSPCNDWIPFGKDKCIKIVDRAGLQTKNDAEIICNSFATELHIEDVPTLVTVKTAEKQRFINSLLFQEPTTFNNVWLGLDMGDDGVYHWNDGSDLSFNNGIKEAVDGSEAECVELSKTGVWAKASCKNRNTVVCERTQPLSTTDLHNILLNLKSAVATNARMLKEANEKIEKLENNPVPIGFMYVQLPGRDPPATIWPQVKWMSVSSEYDGLFFRVETAEAPFGTLQDDQTRSLEQVQFEYNRGSHDPVIPVDGAWSEYAYSGGNGGNKAICLRFRLSKGEVRPKNKSVKIWQRIA